MQVSTITSVYPEDRKQEWKESLLPLFLFVKESAVYHSNNWFFSLRWQFKFVLYCSSNNVSFIIPYTVHTLVQASAYQVLPASLQEAPQTMNCNTAQYEDAPAWLKLSPPVSLCLMLHHFTNKNNNNKQIN